MNPPVAASAIIGLEFMVPDLDGAISVFVEALGWEVVERGPSETVAGTRALLVSPTGIGPAITLFTAADHGPGTIVADRSPRLTQVVVGASDPTAAAQSLERLGLPTEIEQRAIFVDPAAMTGVWGANAALVVTGIEAPDDDQPEP